MNQDAFFGNLHDLFSANNDGNQMPLVPNEPNTVPIASTPISWQISSPKQSHCTQLTDQYQPSSVFSSTNTNITDTHSSFLSDKFINRFNCLSTLEKAFCGVAFGSSIFIILIVVVLLVTTFQHNQQNSHNKKVKESEQEDDIN